MCPYHILRVLGAGAAGKKPSVVPAFLEVEGRWRASSKYTDDISGKDTDQREGAG